MNLQKREIHLSDRIFYWVLKGLAFGLVGLLLAFVYELYKMSLPALHEFGVSFFFTKDWNPVTEKFGALSFIFGTLYSSLVALVISVPVSIATALFLNGVGPRRIRKAVSFLVEMLAAIPSVVYGLWGIFVLCPWLRSSVEPFLGNYLGFLPLFQGPPYGIGMLAAGVILAIMITPTITAVCREVFAMISPTYTEAAFALGATRWEAIVLAILKNTKAGILGAVVLGLGRALGETMAVTMVIGNRTDIGLSLFSPSQTMASVIANEYAEATADVHLASLAAIGLALFFVSLVINALARLVVLSLDKGNRGRSWS